MHELQAPCSHCTRSQLAAVSFSVPQSEAVGRRRIAHSSCFAQLRWVLLPVAAIKLAGAWVPLELQHRGWPGARFWRPLCWSGAAVLVAWGGSNTVVGQLVLAGVIEPAGGYDRASMVGHAWLWDPLFLAWGVALASGRWLSRSTGTVHHTGHGRERESLRADPAAGCRADDGRG